jgi:hypothetical protein
MVEPIVSFYEETDTTELDDDNPEIYGTVIFGLSSEPKVIHIWNDKGGGAGSTPMYNTKIKIVTLTGVETGDTIADGQELVTGKWVGVKSLTNSDVDYTLLGDGVEMVLGDILTNTSHNIECKINVPLGATPSPPDGEIFFELQVIHSLIDV